jgi:hypothetical protein
MPEQVVFRNAERVVSIGDIHGDIRGLSRMLEQAGIIDSEQRWAAGRAHFVNTGDFLDRGAGSRQVMDLFMRLEQEAAAAGGAVHVVIGNHEVMNILGDLRDVSPYEYLAYAPDESAEERARRFEEYRRSRGSRASDVEKEFNERFPPGYFAHRALVGPDGPYGKWLLGKPVLVVVNDTAYMHGGLSRSVANLDAVALNQRFHRSLRTYIDSWQGLERRGVFSWDTPYGSRRKRVMEYQAANTTSRVGGVAELAARFVTADQDEILETNGPVWYRGNSLCHEWSEGPVLRQALATVGVQRLVVGHTFVASARIVSRFDGAYVKIDTGLNRAVYRGRGAALDLRPGAAVAHYDDAEGTWPVQPEPFYSGSTGLRLSDEDLIDTLSTAEPVGEERREDGAVVYILRRDRTSVRALFIPEGDAARREVAAYRLDRLLGIGYVTVAVPREIGGRKGVLQFVPPNVVSQRRLQRQRMNPPAFCALDQQTDIVRVFDLVAGLGSRDGETLLFDGYDWRVSLVAHEAAFGTDRAPRVPRLPTWLQRSDEARRALEAVTRARLDETLGGLLTAAEIDAVEARLALVSERMRGRGG